MKCSVCGKEIEESSYLDCIVCNSSACYNTYYWMEIVKENKKEERHFIEDGVVYCIGKENSYGNRGYGGRLFVFELENGKVFKTTNLWLNGECPEAFRFLFRKIKTVNNYNLNELKTLEEVLCTK